MSTAGTTTDGRVLRGARTRALIVQALLDLLTEGVGSPTAAAIASRADVSVRSVFQHFEDLESLYADLAAEQALRVAPLLSDLPHDGDLAARIDALVTQRQVLYETIRPVRHALGARSKESDSLRRRLDEVSTTLRSQLERQFGEELAALDPATRRVRLDALDVVCSFECWDRMREFQALDAAGAARTMRSVLVELLD